jgi:hypothetical protein
MSEPLIINKVQLSNAALNAIKSIALQTETSKVEHGFRLCGVKSGDIYKAFPNVTCTGSICDIRITGDCQNSELVGSVHTHPSSTVGASLGDTLSLFYKVVFLNRAHGVIECRASKDKLGCTHVPEEIFPRQGDERLIFMDKYKKIQRGYTDQIAPLYDEWAKTGACPVSLSKLGKELKAEAEKLVANTEVWLGRLQDYGQAIDTFKDWEPESKNLKILPPPVITPPMRKLERPTPWITRQRVKRQKRIYRESPDG